MAIVKREVKGKRYLFWVNRIGGVRYSTALGPANPPNPLDRHQIRGFLRRARRFDRQSERMREEARGRRERDRAERAGIVSADREALGAARALGVAADALMARAGYRRHERQHRRCRPPQAVRLQ